MNMPNSSQALSLDTIFSPELIANPYPTYQFLREQHPVLHIPDANMWVLSRYETVTSLLRDKRFGHPPNDSVPKEKTQNHINENPSARMLADMMLFADPPDHTRLRSLVVKAFSAQRVEAMRPRIRILANQLLDTMLEAGSAGDLVASLNHPLPVLVICDILGIPEEDQHQFMVTSGANGRLLDPTPMTEEELAASNERTLSSYAYFEDLFAKRRRHPQEDLLTALVESETEHGKLTAAELTANVNLLFGAGHETTVNLLGNSLLALYRNRDQLNLLRRNPDLMAPAIEEFLRYDSPVQLTGRGAFEKVEIDGHSIPKGGQVIAILGAANHDADKFESPGELDITRTNIKPVSFGGGIHFCLGAQLARIEAIETLKLLFERLPNLELDNIDKPDWKPTVTLRGLSALPATW